MFNLICPECKNNINFSGLSEIKEGSIIECDTCGITLEVAGIEGNNVSLEVIDEGK